MIASDQSKTRTAIGYIRVSTEEQATEGVSLDAQRAKIEAWCQLNDFELLEVCADEGISGKRADNRPGLQEALNRVCREKAALVVFKLERMIRSTRDAIEIAELLRRAGADLVSLTERIDTTSPMGEFFYVLMAAMAQLERRQIGERTKAALGFMRANGQRISRFAPFGYRQSGEDQWEEDTHEQEAVRLILRLRDHGFSLRQIGAELESQGFLNRRGRRLGISVIRCIIRRASQNCLPGCAS